MNLSGEAVKLAVNRIEDLSDLLIVYDDIDLFLGNIRFKGQGSSGGHKGLGSVIEKMKTDQFSRLRIGIRNKDRIFDRADFVLRPFLRAERAIVHETGEKAVEGIETWLSEGISACMTEYNRRS